MVVDGVIVVLGAGRVVVAVDDVETEDVVLVVPSGWVLVVEAPGSAPQATVVNSSTAATTCLMGLRRSRSPAWVTRKERTACPAVGDRRDAGRATQPLI